jgi:hypothetical protein
MSIRRLSVVLISLSILLISGSAFATGYWDCSSVYQCVWVEDHPYYVTLDYEPDWCLYDAGDRVYLHAHIVNYTLYYDQFYVIPNSDYTTQGPSGPGWSGDWYVSSNCTLFSVP